MLYLILLLAFAVAIVQGFMRVIAYFASWLSEGSKIDAKDVARAARAQEMSESARAERMGEAEEKSGRMRWWRRWEASAAAIESYLDNMHLGWYQVVVIFFVGCMAGLLIEEIWMLATAGLTENRVGLVWGPFSPLYGFGAALLTVFCFELRRRGAKTWQIFVISMLVGGLLEQVTGWSMETLFHATSWTYEHLPDHISKWVAWRFLFFWGVLGLVWCRAVMPRLLFEIGMPTSRRQVLFVSLVAVFLAADISMTLVCFERKTQRDAGIPPRNAFEQWVDTNYSDTFIANRFQNLSINDSGSSSK